MIYMIFFALRVKNVLGEHGIRYDVIDAAMAAGFEQLRFTVERASAVFASATGKGRDEFKLVTDAFNRVCNLAAKADQSSPDPALFAEEVEHNLFKAWEQTHESVARAIASDDAKEALNRLAALREPITAYFDKVMVMAEDEAVKRNRLATLSAIAGDVLKLADFSKLVW